MAEFVRAGLGQRTHGVLRTCGMEAATRLSIRRISMRSSPSPNDGDRRRMLQGSLDVRQVRRVAAHGRRGDDVVDVAPAARQRLGDRGVEVGLVEPDGAEPGSIAGVDQVQPQHVVDQRPGVARVGHLAAPARRRPAGTGALSSAVSAVRSPSYQRGTTYTAAQRPATPRLGPARHTRRPPLARARRRRSAACATLAAPRRGPGRGRAAPG